MLASINIMVGFPGETKKQFEASLNLIESTRFDKVHVAAYSSRPGTIAHRKMKDNVPTGEKKARVQAIENLQESIATDINANLKGQVMDVLVEGRQKDQWQGRTRSNKLVFFRHESDVQGKIVDIRIDKTSPWSLQGVVLNEAINGTAR